ncbi:hypothetical protein [Rudaea sp.]|uniref:hypothetical protein n=1 Tax=Rudaea sp. TaxID=2136325 RepID=UPI0025FD570E|nr:hypothetical protein [Rudaea sp.]
MSAYFFRQAAAGQHLDMRLLAESHECGGQRLCRDGKSDLPGRIGLWPRAGGSNAGDDRERGENAMQGLPENRLRDGPAARARPGAAHVDSMPAIGGKAARCGSRLARGRFVAVAHAASISSRGHF